MFQLLKTHVCTFYSDLPKFYLFFTEVPMDYRKEMVHRLKSFAPGARQADQALARGVRARGGPEGLPMVRVARGEAPPLPKKILYLMS